MMKKEGKLKNYMRLVKKELAQCIAQGGLFVINLDDSAQTKYEEKHEPSFYDFFCMDSFPMQILSYKEIKAPECYSRILRGTGYEGKDRKIHNNFYVSLSQIQVIIWTGFKVDEKVNSPTQRRRVQERFAVGFNIPEMDVAILKTDRNLLNGVRDHADDLGKLDKSDLISKSETQWLQTYRLEVHRDTVLTK